MKKLCAIVLLFAVIFSNVGLFTLAEEVNVNNGRERLMHSSPATVRSKNVPDENAVITIIVELDDRALLDAPKAKSMGAKAYLGTSEAKSAKISLESKQDSVKKSILKIDKDAKFNYSYVNVLNGFSADVKAKYITAISEIDGVKSLSRSVLYNPPETKMISSGDMVFPVSKSNRNYRGEGTVVAVIDTGVDVNHELMKLSDESTGKLTKADVDDILKNNNMQAEIKESEHMTSKDVYQNAKFPFCYDYSSPDKDASALASQHGVHVAGTIGANKAAAEEAANKAGKKLSTNNPFDGIAPEAQILGLKVFPDEQNGKAGTDITLAAIEDAITLGADAINLSLGSTAGFTYYDNPTLLAMYEYAPVFEKARNAGVLVAVAAGNEYRTGDGKANFYKSGNPLAVNPDDATIGSPSTKALATSVASVDNVATVSPFIKIGAKEVYFKDAAYPEDYKGGMFTDFVEKNGPFEYIMCGKGLVEGDDEADPDQNDFEAKKDQIPGKVAVVWRGVSNFSKKVQNAKEYGAVACIIVNHTANDPTIPNIAGDASDPVDPETLVPTIIIDLKDGEVMKDNSGDKISASKDFVKVNPYGDGTRMSSFSSWGSTPDLKLKPEITAPGGQIYSTVSGNKYEYMGGTSMATPHVAGGMALMKEYAAKNAGLSGIVNNGELTKVLEAILMSTATVLEDKKSEAPHSPRLQGSGLMNLDAALMDDAVYLMNDNTNKAKVELYDFATDTKEFSFKIVNTSSNAKTYKLTADVLAQNSIAAAAFGGTVNFADTTMRKLENSKISFSNINGGEVTVAPYSELEITATLTVDKAEMDAQKKIFTNGFFVEGFVYLEGGDADTADLSIPYMGFYGDWGKVPMFDDIAYIGDILETGKIPYFTNTVATAKAWSWARFGYVNYYVGMDYSEAVDGSKYVCFSPGNQDDVYDEMTWWVDTFRNAKTMKVSIVDENKQPVKPALFEKLDIYKNGTFEYITKSYYDASEGYVLPGIDASWDGTDKDGKQVEEGQYYMVFEGTPDYAGAEAQKKEFPVIVDNTVPEVKAYYNELTGELTIEAEDNYFLDYAYINLATADGEDYYVAPLEFKNKAVYVIEKGTFADPTELAGNYVYTSDAAGNESETKIELVSDAEVYQGVYDGESHQLVTLTNDEVTAEYSLDGGKTFTDKIPEATDAGEYPITLRLNGGIYQNTLIEVVAIITPVELVATVTVNDKEYDGTTEATIGSLEFEPTVSLVEGTDYDITAEFESPDVNDKAPATVTITMKNNNYVITNPTINVTAKISKAKMTVPLTYKWVYDKKTGEFTVTIEPVDGAEYGFDDAWGDSNVFKTKKPGTLVLGIRIKGDENHADAFASLSVDLQKPESGVSPAGPSPGGDESDVTIWLTMLVVAMAGCMLAQKSKKSKFEI